LYAIVITRHGGPEVLQPREFPDPVPAAGQVRVRTRAAGVNFADTAARVGLYPDAPKPPCVVGYEIAGLVDAVGPGVQGFKEGDRVLAASHFGGYAEAVCVPAAGTLPLPARASFEEGAAVPVNFLTAHHLLHRAGSLQRGDKVLIQQAAGGVGTAVIQLARLHDAEVFGTSSASKHERLRALGLTHPIDYRTQDFADEVERIAGPRALNLVLDPMGEASWKKGYRLLAPAGRLIYFGYSAMVPGERRNWFRAVSELVRAPRYSPLKLMADNRTVGGVNMGQLWDRAEVTRPQMVEVLRLWGEGKVRPIVDRAFPAREAPAAHRYLMERKNFGKVVMTFPL
jgi:NADPH:quinone reductase-like Zn-dependent oxidoreductase